jgi:tol-pal system protein YbgF
VEKHLSLLRAEDNAIRGEVARNFEAVTALRKSTAETGADIADIRDNIQQLRGQVEALRKDLATAVTRTNKDEESREIREKLNNAVFKINFIENFLGIGKREDQPEGTEKGEKPKEVSKGKPDKESAYAAAYGLFKDGKFDKGREAFQNFLKQYPDTEYSDNAQFWIGECYYFEKKYENAILEYEKVAKNYPDGDKVPYALLKQGIAFMNMGDKASAKLILQRVINDYPNTNQARTAKATLLNIK